MSDDEALVRQRLARLTAESSPADPYTALTRPLRSPFEGLDDPATFATTFPRVEPSPPSPRPEGFEPEPEPAGRRLLGGPGPFDPGRRGIKALAVVAAVVVLVAAFFAYRARPKVEPVTAVSAPPAVDAGPATSASGEIFVAVAGKVRKPGLVRLPAGARVADAVEAAGGATPGTDLSTVNLARRLTDGEMVLVGVTPPPGSAPDPSAGGPAVGGAGDGKVNLNTATLAELDSLPGVGPVLAQRILDHRTAKGGFKSVGDLRNVDGIGASRYEDLKDLVTV
ncbi:ComEA family DNA-binding protein [Asanoa sp. WMMD1127]|uniref:ComEA family DNA-binding protein n=1 Tax=Asanoa sp. WMMD1127 TaxID=3016107 RepID=UPI0024180431|nr:ComEA family DNA-binding protein [Asanoa sp. WMMD1127]MDG4827629.1 ComEA family DNA-binding protein [Asanoa sp. WMMD1127]